MALVILNDRIVLNLKNKIAQLLQEELSLNLEYHLFEKPNAIGVRDVCNEISNFAAQIERITAESKQEAAE